MPNVTLRQARRGLRAQSRRAPQREHPPPRAHDPTGGGYDPTPAASPRRGWTQTERWHSIFFLTRHVGVLRWAKTKGARPLWRGSGTRPPLEVSRAGSLPAVAATSTLSLDQQTMRYPLRHIWAWTCRPAWTRLAESARVRQDAPTTPALTDIQSLDARRVGAHQAPG